MIQSRLTPSSERIIEPMLGLAQCSKRHRIIVAGSQRSELMFELHRRGYSRRAARSTTRRIGPSTKPINKSIPVHNRPQNTWMKFKNQR